MINAFQNVFILYKVSDAFVGDGKMDKRYSAEFELMGGIWLRPHDIARRIATVNEEIRVTEKNRIM
jgi:hypothetical protein